MVGDAGLDYNSFHQINLSDASVPYPVAAVAYAPLAPSTFSNLSTRALVLTGDQVEIAGFIISGNQTKTVVIRGMGPTLSSFGVSGFLPDPILELYDQTSLIAVNDNWLNSSNADSIPESLRPADRSTESVILTTLQPGNYTAILRGKNNSTGIGLIEVYDQNSSSVCNLTNVSTRGFVGGGDGVMIEGIIPTGSGNAQVVIRALGPSLAQYGVAGALADPALSLVDNNGTVLMSNNDWKDTQEAQIQAIGFAPPSDRDSAMLVTLQPNNYTAIVRGINGNTGVALVEAYQLK
jgi:hypothetical protein